MLAPVLVNVSSLALPPSLSSGERQFPSSSPIIKSVSQSVRPSVRHKTRHPIPRKGSVTKLETPPRIKARSQNSRPHPEKRLGHKTRDPIPKKGSVTKLETPSRKKARSQNSRAQAVRFCQCPGHTGTSRTRVVLHSPKLPVRDLIHRSPNSRSTKP